MPRQSAMLAAAAAPSLAMANAVDHCDGRLTVIGWDQIVDRMEQQAHDPIILLDAEGVSDELLAATLYRIDAIATARGLKIIAALSEQQIDIVSAGLTGRDVQLLCTPGEADWIAALTIARIADDHVALHDPVREGEAARLARLNEEVARIAEVLARLSRRDDTPQSTPAPSPMCGPDMRDRPQSRRSDPTTFGRSSVRAACAIGSSAKACSRIRRGT